MRTNFLQQTSLKIAQVILFMTIMLGGLAFLPQTVEASTGFSLNSSTSHIGWLFTSSSWDNKNATGTIYNTNATATYDWHVVSGSSAHAGSDYYADDWNWGGGDNDCLKDALSPISGTVIYAGNVGTGYGNTVVIRSNVDGNFAWRGAHLNDLSVGNGNSISIGQKIGRVGKSGGQSSCHLHSVLYKNITQSYSGSTSGVTQLSNGGSLGLSGGPNTFAVAFYNDGIGGSSSSSSSSSQSACATYNATGVVLFDRAQCTGATKQYSSETYIDLQNVGFNDVTRSIYVQNGWSVRIYTDAGHGGTSVCMNGSKWDLTQDKYENGTYIVANNQPTVTGVEVRHNTNCSVPAVSACANYSASGIVLFSSAQCTGSTKQITTESYTDLQNVGFNDVTRSIYVQNGWSVRIYTDAGHGGASRCVNGTMWDLSQDKYDNGSSIINNGQPSITGVEVRHNTNCTVPVVSACATYNQSGLTLFGSAQCTGTTKRYTTTGFYNLTDYSFNDTTRSMSVQSGWSAKIYSDINRGGNSVCVTGTKWDMSADKYSNGTFVVANNQPSISSFDLFSNSTCTGDVTPPTGKMTAPAKNSQNGGNTITLKADASDTGSGVAKVEFYGWSGDSWSNQKWILLGTDTTSPYSYTWDVKKFPKTYAYVTINVYDKAGNNSGLIGDPNWTNFSIH